MFTGSSSEKVVKDLKGDARGAPASPQSSSTCSGPTQQYFLSATSAGVFHFQDGSLLAVNVTEEPFAWISRLGWATLPRASRKLSVCRTYHPL